jgi:hypothetical protein
VVFAVQTNKTFANVIEDLEDRDQQIGLHVQGIGNEYHQFTGGIHLSKGMARKMHC